MVQVGIPIGSFPCQIVFESIDMLADGSAVVTLTHGVIKSDIFWPYTQTVHTLSEEAVSLWLDVVPVQGATLREGTQAGLVTKLIELGVVPGVALG